VRAYLVGGAVRDRMLGKVSKDRDYVVVGETPERMVELGFKPVGKDFPVFIHPETGDEYALARTERKSGRGYKGFTFHYAPDVTLEEDLRRRDLTINAMAWGYDGELVDPHGGLRDVKDKVLRHVSPAFAEDPVRVLRVARFAARFGFKVAEETRDLMEGMVRDGEVDHLVPERTWAELREGLGLDSPSRMLAELDRCGALARILPSLEARWRELVSGGAFDCREVARLARAVLDECAREGLPAEARFAAVATGEFDEEDRALELADGICSSLKVPSRFWQHCSCLARTRAAMRPLADGVSCEGLLDLLEASGWPRDREISKAVLSACRIALTLGGVPLAGKMESVALSAGELLLSDPVKGEIRALGSEASRESVREIRIAALRKAKLCG